MKKYLKKMFYLNYERLVSALYNNYYWKLGLQIHRELVFDVKYYGLTVIVRY